MTSSSYLEELKAKAAEKKEIEERSSTKQDKKNLAEIDNSQNIIQIY